jgi:hypothetical protein
MKQFHPPIETLGKLLGRVVFDTPQRFPTSIYILL